MKKPALIILAAGMGSRYGGLKQIDTIGDRGESIIDFSIYDAIESGFQDLILIIRKEHEQLFEENLVKNIKERVNVQYAYQDMNDIPEGFAVPEGRKKPWGTTHALLSCRNWDGPFAICNADDFYGKEAFQKMYQFLCEEVRDDNYAMIGYSLINTLTDNGSVTRGICQLESDYLYQIEEVSKIIKKDGKVYFEKNNQWIPLPEETMCSMNFWGFTPKIFEQCFPLLVEFMEKSLKEDPMKCEYVIPTAIRDLINKNLCRVKVLSSKDTWFGVTYKEDRALVQEKIIDYKKKGRFPKELWN